MSKFCMYSIIRLPVVPAVVHILAARCATMTRRARTEYTLFNSAIEAGNKYDIVMAVTWKLLRTLKRLAPFMMYLP